MTKEDNVGRSNTLMIVLSVTAQPKLDHLAAHEFRTLLSNRPRGESEDQPDHGLLKAKAESLGMIWHEVPVKPGEYFQADINLFAQILNEIPSPILGFCRTGTRAAYLWTYSQAPHRPGPGPDLIRAAKSDGYDLEPLRERLEKQALQAKSDGYGVCSLVRLSPQSLEAALTFLGSAMLTVLLIRLLPRTSIRLFRWADRAIHGYANTDDRKMVASKTVLSQPLIVA